MDVETAFCARSKRGGCDIRLRRCPQPCPMFGPDLVLRFSPTTSKPADLHCLVSGDSVFKRPARLEDVSNMISPAAGRPATTSAEVRNYIVGCLILRLKTLCALVLLLYGSSCFWTRSQERQTYRTCALLILIPGVVNCTAIIPGAFDSTR
jgi:hypothetical protein